MRYNVAINLSAVNADETIQALQSCIATISQQGLFFTSVAADQTRVGFMEVVALTLAFQEDEEA